MKKVILAVAAIFVSTGAFAQSFEWGVKGGLNLASITKVDDANMKPSFYLGAFAEFKITDFIGIQPELIYSRQGNMMTGTVLGEDVKTWSRLNYLNVPVMVKLYVLDKLSVDIGPQFGFLLNSRVKAKAGGVSATGDLDGIKNFDVSMGLGLSYKVWGPLDVSARYNLGLTKLSDNSESGKNSVIQIGAGYRF